MEELIKIQSELKAPKNQTNKFGGYKYRSSEDILEAVKPLLKKYGCILTISDEVVQVGNRIYVKATSTISKGEHKITTSAFAREEESKKGMDASQITGSASSYARKYALNGLFCIDDTRDADATNNHDKEEPKKEPKKEEPKKIIDLDKEMESATDEIMSAETIEQLSDIWKKYKNLQGNKVFVDMIKEVKEVMQKQKK